MFCEKCGKELKDDWKKCPYCGQAVGKEFINVGSNAEMPDKGDSIYPMDGFPEKKTRKMKKILLGTAAALVVLVVVGIIFSSGNEETGGDGGRENTQDSLEEVKTLEEAGGFAQWKEDGFPGRVQANISIDFPLLNTEKNNYAVYIGVGGINIGVVMQEDEKPVKEWEWLKNAEPDEDTQKAYFNGTLKYLGQEDDKLPVFLISDVKEGDFSGDALKSEDSADIDLESLMGQPEEMLEEAGFTYDEDDFGYSLLDGNVIVDCMDGNVYLIMLTGSEENMPSIHGVKIGMAIEEANELLADKYSETGEMDGQKTYFDLDAGNILGLRSENEKVTEIVMTHLEEGALQEYLGDKSEEMTDGLASGGDGEEGVIVNPIGSTGDFETDVANGVLYGKDGVIVDVNGNVLPDYASYFITEEGYISNGDWVEEGYGIDSTGKIINNIRTYGQQSDTSTELEAIQTAIDTAKQVDIETLLRSPSKYDNTNVCIEATLSVDGFFDNFYVNGNGQDIRIFTLKTVDIDGNFVEKLLSGDHVMIIGRFKYQDYYHEYLGEMQSTIDNAIVILLD